VSCDINIDLNLNLHDAALIREFLFRQTKQDSYEFPGQGTIIIREFIKQLDEQIEANLPDDHDH
tara:strand:- start:173 stop:364 length:192 start_codon:yes stop_codon:yes gene_type:complete